MDENKATEDITAAEEHATEEHAAVQENENGTEGIVDTQSSVLKETEEEEAEPELPKWKKFFFIYPSISRSSYVLRALAGGYVAYLAVTNLKSIMTDMPEDVVLVGVLSLFLLFCGAHLVISGAYALIKQEYS